MIQLKMSECAVLPLVLKGKWYDMIASGEKREEYRDFKPFWNKRIESWYYGRASDDTRKRVVAFSRGYKKADMFFVVIGVCCSDVMCCSDESGFRTSWGEPDTPHWVISLGRRVDLVE